jgi:hypothetical protein
MDDLMRQFRRTHDLEIAKEIAEPIRRAMPFLPTGVYPRERATWRNVAATTPTPGIKMDGERWTRKNSLGAKLYARISCSFYKMIFRRFERAQFKHSSLKRFEHSPR